MDVVTIRSTPSNNHACRGVELKIEPIDSQTGTIIDWSVCTSCKLGNGNYYTRLLHIGTVVEIPNFFEGGWPEASKLRGYSHNKEVDDYTEPQPDTTAIEPHELMILKECK